MTSASSIPNAGVHDRPNPEVYVRKADGELARLFDKPCSEADVGKGCRRSSNRVRRISPCSDYRDGFAIHRRTDQCYKLEKPRRFRGVWIDEFEGQQFILQETNPPEWPRFDRNTPGWAQQIEKAQAARIWLDNSRVNLAPFRSGRSAKVLIEFVGRKTKYAGRYGHMGMSGNEIVVDRVISLKSIE